MEWGGGREFQKGRDICIPMADSCWGLTEKKQNSVKQLCFNKKWIKNKKRKKYILIKITHTHAQKEAWSTKKKKKTW